MVDEEVAPLWFLRLLRALFRCKRFLVSQDKIHTAPVKYILMATSSSTACAVPRKGAFCLQKVLRGLARVVLRWRRLFYKSKFADGFFVHRFRFCCVLREKESKRKKKCVYTIDKRNIKLYNIIGLAHTERIAQKNEKTVGDLPPLTRAR